MRVLITGGAGYIGSHTMIEVLAAGHDTMVVDNFANASPVALERIMRLAKRGFAHTEANIGDERRMAEVFDDFRPEAVLHFAGLKAVGDSVAMPLEYYQENVAGTVALLKVMEAAGCQKIVFSSSATVYGAAQNLPITETQPLAPTNPYGRTKQMIEMIITDWVAAGMGRAADMGRAAGTGREAGTGRAAMLLRYFNPVGAHPSGDIGENPLGTPANLMPLLGRVAGGRLPHLEIFGDDYDTPDRTGIRDYIHVSDLARGHVAALDYIAGHGGRGERGDHEGRGGHGGVEAVNLGTGRGYSVKEVVAAFEAASGAAIPTRIAPRRPGDVAASYASVDKARAVLGWQARLGLADMCADAWHWQTQNPYGYEGG